MHGELMDTFERMQRLESRPDWPLYRCRLCGHAVEFRDGRSPEEIAVFLAAFAHCNGPQEMPALRGGASSIELGDAVEKALSFVGITPDRVHKWLGHSCSGCAERKEKLNQLSRWAKNAMGETARTAKKKLGALIGVKYV
jgi:hypothetical protein